MNKSSIFFLNLLLALAFCIDGIFVRTAITNFACFVEKGFTSNTIRGYLNIGKVDPNARNNIIAASKANMDTNIFINPCLKCSAGPREQIREVITALKGTGFNCIIIKVQLIDKWSSNKTANCHFLKEMMSEMLNRVLCSIVSSDAPVWNMVVGSDCKFTEFYNLEWDKHNKIKNFNNFVPFGGFKKPLMKE